MSQGILGIIDFNRPLENPEQLAAKMGKFLSRGSFRKTETSIIFDNHYILGMKRFCENSHQRAAITKKVYGVDPLVCAKCRSEMQSALQGINHCNN